jgi:hypothetical protein
VAKRRKPSARSVQKILPDEKQFLDTAAFQYMAMEREFMHEGNEARTVEEAYEFAKRALEVRRRSLEHS